MKNIKAKVFLQYAQCENLKVNMFRNSIISLWLYGMIVFNYFLYEKLSPIYSFSITTSWSGLNHSRTDGTFHSKGTKIQFPKYEYHCINNNSFPFLVQLRSTIKSNILNKQRGNEASKNWLIQWDGFTTAEAT